MKSVLLFGLLAYSVTSFGADVKLGLDPVEGATGYRIEMSVDMGETWPVSQDLGDQTEYVYPDVPEDTMVFFRAVAYNEHHVAIRQEAGVWYDHRRRPITKPSGLGAE